jgi:hypothetical protein
MKDSLNNNKLRVVTMVEALAVEEAVMVNNSLLQVENKLVGTDRRAQFLPIHLKALQVSRCTVLLLQLDMVKHLVLTLVSWRINSLRWGWE